MSAQSPCVLKFLDENVLYSPQDVYSLLYAVLQTACSVPLQDRTVQTIHDEGLASSS